MNFTSIGSFLNRSKIPIEIQDNKEYKRVTIRINHNGVSLRDKEIGKKIGTKKQFVLKAGQFILSKIDARYGAFGIAPNEVDGAIITGNFWAYDVDNAKVNIEWFNQFTNSPDFYELCEKASSGITHRKYLDESFFLNHKILLPSIEEQLIQIEKIKEQKVAFNLLTLELFRQRDLVDQLRQSFLLEAMQGKLVSQDATDGSANDLIEKITSEKKKSKKKEKSNPPISGLDIPFEIPKNWVWCRMGEILSEIKYGTSQSCDYDSSKNSAVLRIPNVSSGIINGSDLKFTNLKEKDRKELSLEKDDILIIRSNGSRELVGRTVLVTSEFVGYTFAGYLVRLRFNKSLIYPKFLWFATNSVHFRKLIEKPLRTTVGINNINTEEIANLYLPLPPHAEQIRIVEKLELLIAFCDDLEVRTRFNIKINEILLQQALSKTLDANSIIQ